MTLIQMPGKRAEKENAAHLYSIIAMRHEQTEYPGNCAAEKKCNKELKSKMGLVVSGRYRGSLGSSKRNAKSTELELRVDVDRMRPMKVVSGDVYSISGRKRQYLWSFISEGVKVKTKNDTVIITGVGGKFSSQPDSFSKILVTIPLRSPLQATAQMLSSSGQSSTFSCAFESQYFRSIEVEQDYESNVTPFKQYDTKQLDSGRDKNAPSKLTVEMAFAEAGIEVQRGQPSALVPTQEAGLNETWSDSELHASMQKHFSKWKDEPQWKVWQFSASEYDDPTYIGMMFDNIGKPRQGCAVFHKYMNGAGSSLTRLQLFTYIHELGHCFNLLHSWQKSRATPSPGVDSNSSLSWMNYPHQYPPCGTRGEAAFWRKFAFQFLDSELVHLRHGLRDYVIFGGNELGIGAAFESGEDLSTFTTPSEDRSGLQLRLESPKVAFAYGEPVVVEIRLSTRARLSQCTQHSRKGATKTSLHACLHPKMGLVQIAIRDPSNRIRIYKPLFSPLINLQVAVEKASDLDKEHPIYDSAFIGYGQDGFYFRNPGMYQIRATYHALDGSNLVSNILKFRVRYPLNQEDEEIADLLQGDAQGTLLYLKGSDSVTGYLRNGNTAFNQLIKKHPSHPLTVYAKFIKGFNKGRWFKTITPEKKIKWRPPRFSEAEKLLSSVTELSQDGGGLDNISLNMTMRHLAKLQKFFHKEREASATMELMKEIFSKKKLRPSVMETLTKEAEQTLA